MPLGPTVIGGRCWIQGPIARLGEPLLVTGPLSPREYQQWSLAVYCRATVTIAEALEGHCDQCRVTAGSLQVH